MTISVKNKLTFTTPLGSALTAVRTAWRYCFSPNSSCLPNPTTNTRAACRPVNACNNKLLPALPSKSPVFNTALIALLLAASILFAASLNFLPSNTPTTKQSDFCFSGFPIFMLNSTVCPLRFN